MIIKYLIGYESAPLLCLSDKNYRVKLKFETVWFWGLFKTNSTQIYDISEYSDMAKYFNHWDNLIKNQTPI